MCFQIFNSLFHLTNFRFKVFNVVIIFLFLFLEFFFLFLNFLFLFLEFFFFFSDFSLLCVNGFASILNFFQKMYNCISLVIISFIQFIIRQYFDILLDNPVSISNFVIESKECLLMLPKNLFLDATRHVIFNPIEINICFIIVSIFQQFNSSNQSYMGILKRFLYKIFIGILGEYDWNIE